VSGISLAYDLWARLAFERYVKGSETFATLPNRHKLIDITNQQCILAGTFGTSPRLYEIPCSQMPQKHVTRLELCPGDEP
jgi:hypothetical protein